MWLTPTCLSACSACLLSLIDDSVKLAIEDRGSASTGNTILLPSTTSSTSKLAEKVLDSTINIPPLIYQNQGGIVGIYVRALTTLGIRFAAGAAARVDNGARHLAQPVMNPMRHNGRKDRAELRYTIVKVRHPDGAVLDRALVSLVEGGVGVPFGPPLRQRRQTRCGFGGRDLQYILFELGPHRGGFDDRPRRHDRPDM